MDETDIVNIQIGQPAEVTVDALPGKVFKGHVTLVGDQALLRSTGVATSQSTTGTEEAKDFKVVVTLDNPYQRTAPRTLHHRQDHHRAQDQRALAAHPGADHAQPRRRQAQGQGRRAGRFQFLRHRAKSPPVQGVYVVDKDKNGKLRAKFVPVTTGITGATDIEVLSGLNEGQEIVTGPYKTLRALKNGALVKRDTAKPVIRPPARPLSAVQLSHLGTVVRNHGMKSTRPAGSGDLHDLQRPRYSGNAVNWADRPGGQNRAQRMRYEWLWTA